MRIPDRERRRWSFDRAGFLRFARFYLIGFVGLAGVYVVVDAITNLDELAELAESTPDLLGEMGRHYVPRLGLIHGQLCGIITLMSAVCTAIRSTSGEDRIDHRPSSILQRS